MRMRDVEYNQPHQLAAAVIACRITLGVGVSRATDVTGASQLSDRTSLSLCIGIVL